MNRVIWTLPCLAIACAGTPERPAQSVTNAEAACRTVDDRPDANTSPDRAQCARREVRAIRGWRTGILCDDAYMHPEFYTETERIRCEYEFPDESD